MNLMVGNTIKVNNHGKENHKAISYRQEDSN